MSGEGEKTASGWEITQLRSRVKFLESKVARLVEVLARIDECGASLDSLGDRVRVLSARVAERVEVCELLREHLAVLGVNERVIKDSLTGDDVTHRRRHMLRLSKLGAERAEVEAELGESEGARSRLVDELTTLQCEREHLEFELKNYIAERKNIIDTLDIVKKIDSFS